MFWEKRDRANYQSDVCFDASPLLGDLCMFDKFAIQHTANVLCFASILQALTTSLLNTRSMTSPSHQSSPQICLTGALLLATALSCSAPSEDPQKYSNIFHYLAANLKLLLVSGPQMKALYFVTFSVFYDLMEETEADPKSWFGVHCTSPL